MTEILVDTSALITFFVSTETNHAAMKSFCLKYPQAQWIILSTVFDETVTWLRIRKSVAVSIKIGQLLRTEHRYLALSMADDEATWEAFKRYDDKLWSYTDCSLLVMASRLGVSTVVSFDEHIRQMRGLGVVCLP